MPWVCGDAMLKKKHTAIGTPVMSLVYNKKPVLDRKQVVESINKPCS